MNRRQLAKYLLGIPFAGSLNLLAKTESHYKEVEVQVCFLNSKNATFLGRKTWLVHETPNKFRKCIALHTDHTKFNQKIEKIKSFKDVQTVVVYYDQEWNYSVVGFGKGFSIIL